MDTIAYGDAPQEDTSEPVNYGAPNVGAALSEDHLDARSKRADFAMADKSPGQQVLKDQFRSGGEPQFRQAAAATADAEFRQDKLTAVQGVAAKTNVTDTDVNGLMAIGTTPEANPNTVIEDKFAKNMVNYGVAGDPGKNLVFQTAFDTHPEQTQQQMAVGKGAISRKAQAQDVQELSEAAYNSLPWINTDPNQKDQQDKLGAFFQDILTAGFSTYVQQRNLLNDSSSNSILPGSNKLEQIQYLYLLPHAEFKPALMAAAGPGSKLWKDNPTAALDFVKSAVSFSTSDAYVDNAFGIANAASLIPIGTGLRAIGRLGKGAEEASKGVQTLDKALEEFKAVAQPSKTAAGVDKKIAESDAVKYYLPEAAVKRPWESAPRIGETRVENGVPRVFTDDGSEVALGNTPEPGHIPVTVSEDRVRNYTTKQGTVDFTPEGDGKTIYVSKADSQKLSQSLDPDQNYTLLRDDKGVHVADLDNIRPGKMVPGSRVTKVSDTPGEGLYPVKLPEGTNKPVLDDFGDRITKVQDGTVQNVRFGAKIVPDEELETRIAMADIVKAQAETHPVDVLSKMGQHEAAAETKAVQDLQNRFQSVAAVGDVEAIRRNVPSLYSPQTFFHNASSLTRERADRLGQEALQSVNDLSAAIVDPTRVERLTSQAFDKAVQDAKTQVSTKYNRASNSILDQQTHWDSASNTYFVETKFGKKDGTLFDSKASALNYKNLQYKLGSSAEIKQEGNQFYLSHVQHLDETAKGVRDSLIVSENTTPQGFWNTLVNTVSGKVLPGYGAGSSLRSSAFTVSDFARNNRTVATHAPSIMRQAMEEAATTIGNVSKAERQELQRILEHNRDYMHPDGERGIFYKSALEFETAFNSMHGKMPTEKQITAYDQFTRLSDLDWTLRELDWHRDKARQGVRNYRLSFKADENGLPGNGKTDWFNGKLVENFDPLNTQNANIYIMPEQTFTTKFNLKSPTVAELEINKKIKSGEYQILQVYNPGSKPLKGATQINDNIHFVVVDKYEDQAVKFGQNSVYRPGGHVIYQDQNFMKQPQIGTGTLGRETHFGDTSVKSFATERDGQAWVDKYNAARLMLHNGDEAGLKAFIDAGNLPETLPEFKKLFTGGGANLSTEHPFVLTKTGANTFESSAELQKAYPGLKDTFSSYDLTQTQDSKFLASRDKQLSTIANKGTEENPLYVNVDSRLYDPYTSLQKGVAQIVRERWMGDYKKQAAESWVQEFGTLFDQSKLPLDKLRQNPVYWVYHAEGNLQSKIAQTQPELYSAALVSRRNIMNFIGAQDEVSMMMSGLEKKVISGIESIGGKSLALKAEETILPLIKDAPSYARAGAFHAIIGNFNPIQLFQQAQGLTHVLALSPMNGLNGTTASALARIYRYTEDPAILSSMFDKAAAMGWKRDHIEEAWNAWKSSGTHAIGGETALLDQVGEPKLFKSGANQFLDKGQIFFKAGESIVRDTGFFTAYADWRAANPAAVLDNRAMGDITRRFDTLTMNMTRASNAAYNEGILSPVTQFWTWNARFAEQMIGKQLTMGEKARAFAGYSAMYGVPATLGGVTFGTIPYLNYQDIREYAIKNQIDLSDKFYQAFSEGLPAMLTNAVTGHETDFQRFAPNATQISDIVSGKKSVLDVIGGASGSWVRNVYASTQPFRAYVWSGLDENLGLKMNDFVGLAENMSGFTNLEKAYVGLTTGKYMSKNELYQGDVDNFDSMMLALGLPPKAVSDAYSKIDIGKAQKSVWDKTEKLMMENYRIGFAAAQRGDYQSMSDYMMRNNALSAAADFTMQKKMDVFKKATGGQNDNLVDSVNQSFLKNQNSLQNIPAMKRYYELQEKRKQP